MADPDREQLLRGILALIAADRAERRPDAAVPTEFLLRNTGMTHAEIGEIVGEKENTVRMRITRYEDRLQEGKAKTKTKQSGRTKKGPRRK